MGKDSFAPSLRFKAHETRVSWVHADSTEDKKPAVARTSEERASQRESVLYKCYWILHNAYLTFLQSKNYLSSC
jgi:hypothetical protein